jgi:hypothetical protein
MTVRPDAWHKTVIYELHIKGFAASSPGARGTQNVPACVLAGARHQSWAIMVEPCRFTSTR